MRKARSERRPPGTRWPTFHRASDNPVASFAAEKGGLRLKSGGAARGPV